MLRFPARMLVTLLLLSLATVPPALARRAQPPRTAPATPATGAPIAFAPAFVPTPLPTLSAAEEQAISRSTVNLVPFRLASGAVGIDLQGGFQDFAVLSVGANGKFVIHCVDDAGVLRRLLAPPAATATPVVPAPAVLEDR